MLVAPGYSIRNCRRMTISDRTREDLQRSGLSPTSKEKRLLAETGKMNQKK